MPLVYLTAYSLALKFLGCHEAPGAVHNPAIVSMLNLVDRSARADEVPWCSAFVNYVAWLLDLPRSNSLAARSWLKVGLPISLHEAVPGFDVVVLARGAKAPGPDVLKAPGHVGFFAGLVVDRNMVRVLGGNQGDCVSEEAFPIDRVLGVRRLLV